MKNWTLFYWAVSHLKVEEGKYQRSLRNTILVFLMDLSGVKPKDVKAILYTEDYTFRGIDLA